MMQSPFHSKWFVDIMKLNSGRCGIECGVGDGGTYAMLATLCDDITGIDIEPMSDDIHSKMVGIPCQWNYIREDCTNSKYLRGLDDDSVDKFHYDAMSNGKDIAAVINIMYNKMKDDGIWCFDNFHILHFSAMLILMRQWLDYHKGQELMLYPFAIVSDNDRRGKIYLTKNRVSSSRYYRKISGIELMRVPSCRWISERNNNGN